MATSGADISETNNSFLTNLTNKISYKLQEAAYDPKADEYAKKKAEQKKELEKQAEEKKDQNTDIDKKNNNNIETTVSEGDPNTFSGKRLAKKVYNQFINTITKIIVPFIALMIAMIVANEMIVYAAPIRVVFFLFTLLIIIFYPLASIVLPVFYIFKGGYSYYVNNMTDKPRRIMPTIYSLLPITTYQPTSRLGSFFLYPFTYPKTESGAQELPKIIEDYWNSLVDSFKGYDKISKLPIFAAAIGKAHNFIENINKPSEVVKKQQDGIESQTTELPAIKSVAP